MTQTFTLRPTLTEKTAKNENKPSSFGAEGPSESVINNILNFSKNLEIKHSRLVPAIEIVKS